MYIMLIKKDDHKKQNVWHIFIKAIKNENNKVYDKKENQAYPDDKSTKHIHD